MAKPELTKKLIADTLKNLVLKSPIDKITIHDIIVACGINRATFYYHFNDKQSLIYWIFNEEFSKYDDKPNYGELLKSIVIHMYSNKDFYIPALLSEVQNNLRLHLFKLAHERCLKEVNTLLGSRQLTEHSRNFIANYFANAIIGCIVQWAQDGMKINPTKLDMDIVLITTDCMKLIVDQNAK